MRSTSRMDAGSIASGFAMNGSHSWTTAWWLVGAPAGTGKSGVPEPAVWELAV